MGSNPTPSALSARVAVIPRCRRMRAPTRRVGGRGVFLDIEVTVIEIDNDGDGSVDEELVIVEDIPE